jgi:hypothetical protein
VQLKSKSRRDKKPSLQGASWETMRSLQSARRAANGLDSTAGRTATASDVKKTSTYCASHDPSIQGFAKAHGPNPPIVVPSPTNYRLRNEFRIPHQQTTYGCPGLSINNTSIYKSAPFHNRRTYVVKKSKRVSWSNEHIRTMKSLARKKTPASKIARALKRTEGATRQKAFSLGLSLDSRD